MVMRTLYKTRQRDGSFIIPSGLLHTDDFISFQILSSSNVARWMAPIQQMMLCLDRQKKK
uniref:AlNc14C193G8518 protein n=1 Tax=Albugo laibachii Nc14 TaxID=890382 RepID=F0WQ38_9STRA|nr:AlNc14C193G8518 [Albugo laibachii Nc14]|eukprot:CCA23443.1 AlNc14C193G8518 [Albugo laibachii Nc14]